MLLFGVALKSGMIKTPLLIEICLSIVMLSLFKDKILAKLKSLKSLQTTKYLSNSLSLVSHFRIFKVPLVFDKLTLFQSGTKEYIFKAKLKSSATPLSISLVVKLNLTPSFGFLRRLTLFSLELFAVKISVLYSLNLYSHILGGS